MDILIPYHTGRTADRQLTAALEKAALTIDIRVHDHIIIGKNTHFSGREHGWLAGKQPTSSTRVADRRTT